MPEPLVSTSVSMSMSTSTSTRGFRYAALVVLGAPLVVLCAVATACRAEPGAASDAASAQAPARPGNASEVALDHTVTDIDGRQVSLASFRGKALLVVNVASECGYTPQYEQLQRLYATYQDRGLVVLGFPSNDFGGQEPGSSAEIKKFAADQYGVTFPLFEKIHATGENIAPLYKTLTTATRFPGPVKWNFTKFLVDTGGRVVARFPSDVAPMAAELVAAVEAALPPPG